MSSDSTMVPRRRRKRRIYNKVRQLEWLLWKLLSENTCCFCNRPLREGFDPKKVNITIHHLDGSVETDNRREACPFNEQLYAHGSCHRGYHHMERLLEKGANVDMKRLRAMQKCVARHAKVAEKRHAEFMKKCAA